MKTRTLTLVWIVSILFVFLILFFGVRSVNKKASAVPVPVGQNAPAPMATEEYREMAQQIKAVPPPPPAEPDRRILQYSANGVLLGEFRSSGPVTYLPGPFLKFFDANNKRTLTISGVFVIEDLPKPTSHKLDSASAPKKKQDQAY